MLLIDNTAKLNQIMEFKPNTYYKFIALIRAKDYSSEDEQVLKCMEKREILVKDWLIDSQEMLDKTLPDMLTVTEMFKCRLYMCTDRKSIVKTLLQMRKNVDTYLDPFIGNPKAECSVRAIKKSVHLLLIKTNLLIKTVEDGYLMLIQKIQNWLIGYLLYVLIVG